MDVPPRDDVIIVGDGHPTPSTHEMLEAELKDWLVPLLAEGGNAPVGSNPVDMGRADEPRGYRLRFGDYLWRWEIWKMPLPHEE